MLIYNKIFFFLFSLYLLFFYFFYIFLFLEKKDEKIYLYYFKRLFNSFKIIIYFFFRFYFYIIIFICIFFFLILFLMKVTLDVPLYKGISFQEPANYIMLSIINFHGDLMFYLVFIVLFVLWVLFRCVSIFSLNFRAFKFCHNSVLEIIWTLIPILILSFIAIPSLSLLFSIDEENITPKCTIKVIGRQWYWTYEASKIFIGNILEFSKIRPSFEFDSYMIMEDSLKLGQFRLLEVTKPLILPISTKIRFLITSSDVIHSWTIPSLGIKVDATPGRLNQITTSILRTGVFYGQCSEICGINHAFMPIVLKGIPKIFFYKV
jgi:cytochrome c oxidase subunit 2